MEILNWPRSSGKTTAAMEWLLEDPLKRVIIVPDISMARPLQDRLEGLFAKHPGLIPESFMGPREWDGRQYTQKLHRERVRDCVVTAGNVERLMGRDVEVFVDEIELVLRAFLRRPVVAGSCTATDGYLAKAWEHGRLGWRNHA